MGGESYGTLGTQARRPQAWSEFLFAVATGGTPVDSPSDILVLGQKCELEPVNCYLYATLIIDIDPTNQHAVQYPR